MTNDAVCGRDIDPDEALRHGLYHDIEGRRFWFCSQACKDKFDQHPTAYTLAEAEWRASDEGMPQPYDIPEDLT